MTTLRPADPAVGPRLRDPAFQAYTLLRTVFTIAPIAFGLDKFFDVLTNWEQYLAGPFNDIIPGTAHQAMLMVGVAGATFALIGAGVGAAVGNTPGALTGIYLLDLGVLPVLQTVKPALADRIDPGNAILELAQGTHQALSVTILAVWVGVSLAAGTWMNHRRAVQ